jgi:hypothetical protein
MGSSNSESALAGLESVTSTAMAAAFTSSKPISLDQASNLLTLIAATAPPPPNEDEAGYFTEDFGRRRRRRLLGAVVAAGSRRLLADATSDSGGHVRSALSSLSELLLASATPATGVISTGNQVWK